MQLGVVGLGRMGGNIVRRLTAHRHECVILDRAAAVSTTLAKELGVATAATLEDLVARLRAPRRVWLMLPAGAATEETIATLARLLSADDVVIDGGNSFWQDDLRRARLLAAQRLHYVDVGVSGGIGGLDRGYCMMIGGEKSVVADLEPIFRALAPDAGAHEPASGVGGRETRGGKGFIHVGSHGAGHFVKMVHNGIEYGLMQAYAEGFDILRGAASAALPEERQFTLDLPGIAEVWRHGSIISSRLLDLIAVALGEDEGLAAYAGVVEDSGEGRWTVAAAIDEAVPADVLSAALYARFRSRGQAQFANKLLSAMRRGFGGHTEAKAE